MTLILTYMSTRGVVQAADRRISYPDRDPYDGARKSIVCPTDGGVFTVSYTGAPAHFLSHASNVPIPFEEWLCRHIALAAQPSSPAEVVRWLSDALAGAITPSRVHFGLSHADSRFSIVCAGVENDQPFFACTTNFEDFATRLQHGTRLRIPFAPQARRQFFSTGRFNGWVVPYGGSSYCLLANGAVDSLDDLLAKRLLRLLENNFHHEGGLSAVARILGWGIEKAARNRPTVSSESLSVAIPVGEGPIVAENHARRVARPTVPRICGPSHQVELLVGPPPEDHSTATIALDAELTPQVYEAFVRSDEEARYWTRYLAGDRETLDAWTDVNRDWEVAQYCGITTAGQLRNLLVGAHGWGVLAPE